MIYRNTRGVAIRKGCCSCYHKKMGKKATDPDRICGLSGEGKESDDICEHWICAIALDRNAGKGDGRDLKKVNIDKFYAMVGAQEKRHRNRNKKQ